MFRSTFLTLVVASGAVVLATSLVPGAMVGAPGAAPASRPDARAGPSPPEPPSGSHQRWSGSPPVVRPAGGSAIPRARAGSSPRARPGAAPETGDRARWRWPLRPRPAVLRPFRAPESTYAAGHRGLDLAVDDGAAVLAVEGGVVSHAGVVAGRGTVTVSHGGKLSSTYEPVDAVVVQGAVVSAGDVLGTLRVRDGPAHCGGRACLHLGARRDGSYLDPYPLLAGGRPVLLPLR
jgi:murein DD-endopeptidase MepM/ murein hydrolase activator NlpD